MAILMFLVVLTLPLAQTIETASLASAIDLAMPMSVEVPGNHSENMTTAPSNVTTLGSQAVPMNGSSATSLSIFGNTTQIQANGTAANDTLSHSTPLDVPMKPALLLPIRPPAAVIPTIISEKDMNADPSTIEAAVTKPDATSDLPPITNGMDRDSKKVEKQHVRARTQKDNSHWPPEKDMLIAVVSAPAHVAARKSIRNSYMKTAKRLKRVDVKFFVGQLPPDFPNREEADRHITAEEDMVRLDDFVEAYHNLSYKALDIFKYAADSNYRSVFKVDDDTYVRVQLALQFYDNQLGDPFIYAGDFVNGQKAMVSDPNSKWYMRDQYPHDRLEDYANGPGVLLGQQALFYLRDNYDKLFRYRVDDAAIAIWLKDMPMHKLAMPVDMYSYYVHPDTVWINPVNSEEMEDIHQGLTETLEVCRQTCLCWGGPPKPGGGCLDWGEFMSSGYRDLIPRLL